MEVLKVSSHSSPNSVAGAIAGVIREKKMVEVQAVGAGGANQAVKAIAIARASRHLPISRLTEKTALQSN